jgi:hypothetical protein
MVPEAPLPLFGDHPSAEAGMLRPRPVVREAPHLDEDSAERLQLETIEREARQILGAAPDATVRLTHSRVTRGVWRVTAARAGLARASAIVKVLVPPSAAGDQATADDPTTAGAPAFAPTTFEADSHLREFPRRADLLLSAVRLDGLSGPTGGERADRRGADVYSQAGPAGAPSSGGEHTANPFGMSTLGCVGGIIFCVALAVTGFSFLFDLSGGLSDPYGVYGIDSTASDNLMGVWGLAIAACAMCLLSLYIGVASSHRLRRMAKLVAATVGTAATILVLIAPAVWAADGISRTAPQRQLVQRTLGQAGQMCNGHSGIAGAHEYTGEVHSLVAMVTAGSPSTDPELLQKTGELGPLPADISTLQVVACVGPIQTTAVETCDYDKGGTYTRYRYSIEASVYAARTGAVLGSRTFKGSEPEQCPASKEVGKGFTGYGSMVDAYDQDVWDYIKTFAGGPKSTP